jgi:hypothetical protein
MPTPQAIYRKGRRGRKGARAGKGLTTDEH